MLFTGTRMRASATLPNYAGLFAKLVLKRNGIGAHCIHRAFRVRWSMNGGSPEMNKK